jgi:hypothetical protein
MDNECISCLEIITSDKLIYLLPCLHQVCSYCINDLNKCIVCYEHFDLEIVIGQNYSNDFLNLRILKSMIKTIKMFKILIK